MSKLKAGLLAFGMLTALLVGAGALGFVLLLVSDRTDRGIVHGPGPGLATVGTGSRDVRINYDKLLMLAQIEYPRAVRFDYLDSVEVDGTLFTTADWLNEFAARNTLPNAKDVNVEDYRVTLAVRVRLFDRDRRPIADGVVFCFKNGGCWGPVPVKDLWLFEMDRDWKAAVKRTVGSSK